MTETIFFALGASLALTLMVECWYAILYKVRRQDMLLLILANLLTNPVVVLGHCAVQAVRPEYLAAATLALELGAVSAEGYLYSRRSQIKRPWLFSLSANALSYAIGCLF